MLITRKSWVRPPHWPFVVSIGCTKLFLKLHRRTADNRYSFWEDISFDDDENKTFAPGEARTLDLRISLSVLTYKYDALTDCATGAANRCYGGDDLSPIEVALQMIAFNEFFFGQLLSWFQMQRRDRIVVSTLRCGRNNPGSNPGHGRTLGCPIILMDFLPAMGCGMLADCIYVFALTGRSLTSMRLRSSGVRALVL